MDKQLAAMRRGLLCFVPPDVLALWNGCDLEEAAAGEPSIDVDKLKVYSIYIYFFRSHLVLRINRCGWVGPILKLGFKMGYPPIFAQGWGIQSKAIDDCIFTCSANLIGTETILLSRRRRNEP